MISWQHKVSSSGDARSSAPPSLRRTRDPFRGMGSRPAHQARLAPISRKLPATLERYSLTRWSQCLSGRERFGAVFRRFPLISNASFPLPHDRTHRKAVRALRCAQYDILKSLSLSADASPDPAPSSALFQKIKDENIVPFSPTKGNNFRLFSLLHSPSAKQKEIFAAGQTVLLATSSFLW